MLANMLYLARSEFAVLETRCDLHELRALVAAGRVRAMYVADDVWAPLSFRERLAARLGMVADELRACDEPPSAAASSASSASEPVRLRHAFSVQDASCALVAEWTARAIAQMAGWE